ncbi:unnamed protein product, partial [Scytosiphon promiscuus]
LQGQPFDNAHWTTPRYPFAAAAAQVESSPGHPLSRAHSRAARCPPAAADRHVPSSKGQPCSHAQRRRSTLPCDAEAMHSSGRFWGRPHSELCRSGDMEDEAKTKR